MKWLVAPSALILTQTCNEGHLTLTTRVSYPITGELFPVHFNTHVSFPFFVSSKLQLNLHLRQVTISLKTAACSPRIFTIASRVCPHKLPNQRRRRQTQRMDTIREIAPLHAIATTASPVQRATCPLPFHGDRHSKKKQKKAFN